MILTFLVLLLLSNGLTVRPDTSILYSRIGLIIIFYSLFSAYTTFYIEYLERGVSLYSGLFNVTSITHTFQMFILLICGLILLMTAFYPRKKNISNSTSILNTLLEKIKEKSPQTGVWNDFCVKMCTVLLLRAHRTIIFQSLGHFLLQPLNSVSLGGVITHKLWRLLLTVAHRFHPLP